MNTQTTSYDGLLPEVKAIHLKDIIKSLSAQRRYLGHCLYPVTVMEHSLLVYHISKYMWPDQKNRQLLCLMHDFAEAYIGDIVYPLKKHLVLERCGALDGESTSLGVAEHLVLERIFEALGLQATLQSLRVQADTIWPCDTPNNLVKWSWLYEGADLSALAMERVLAWGDAIEVFENSPVSSPQGELYALMRGCARCNCPPWHPIRGGVYGYLTRVGYEMRTSHEEFVLTLIHDAQNRQ